MQHVFIVGSKGIPATYGGFETFVDKLTEYNQNSNDIQYHIACKSNLGNKKALYKENCRSSQSAEFGFEDVPKFTKDFFYHNAHCFYINVPNIGAAQAIYYDVVAINYCCRYIKQHRIKHPVVYILACRVGPFAGHFQRVIHQLGGLLYVNPDGHEFLRAKWSGLVKRYWKYSERLMVKHADLLVCDSCTIEKYIHNEYRKYNPQTTFIAYGAEISKSTILDHDSLVQKWYKEKNLSPKSYYLIVGRFVPENNFETMIREFMKSSSARSLAIITTVDEKFLEELEQRLHFGKDPRIKFVGTLYNKELLKKVRENAYGYLHGHEVGGTNPSLLEALASTDLNLLLDVEFNQEVAKTSALYWNKTEDSLSALIDKTDQLEKREIEEFSQRAKRRIMENYNWGDIVQKYKKIFCMK